VSSEFPDKKRTEVVLQIPAATNPYQRLLARGLEHCGVGSEIAKPQWQSVLRLALRRRATIVHFHWLHGFALKKWLIPFVPQTVVLMQVALLRLLGRRIVWTAHNLSNHENRQLTQDYSFTWVMTRLSHRIIAHGEMARQRVVDTFGVDRRKVVVIPLGHYIDCYPNDVSQPKARARLGLPPASLVVLFFGWVRRNKGAHQLVRTFRDRQFDDMYLLVAGKVNKPALAEALEDESKGAPNVHLHLKFVPDEDVQIFLNSADVVVFPYQDILTSSAVVLAMSFGKPCIGVRLGCIEEVLDERGAFLYDRDDPDGLKRCLKAARDAGVDRLREMGAYNRNIAAQWDWDGIARATLDVYRGGRQDWPLREVPLTRLRQEVS
jgi:glycosyltransferase involved in cell wall biosynthesis